MKRNLQKLVTTLPDVEDVLLFGSAVRGKVQPKDIDILILFKKKVDKHSEYLIRKELENYYSNLSIVSKTLTTALEPTFDARESILFEGVSLLSRKNLAQTYGFVSFGMFKYAVKGWSNVQKTKFYYALNGRSGNGGILREYHSMRLSDNIVLTPIESIEPMRDFLDSWQIRYLYIPVVIPARLQHARILQQL